MLSNLLLGENLLSVPYWTVHGACQSSRYSISVHQNAEECHDTGLRRQLCSAIFLLLNPALPAIFLKKLFFVASLILVIDLNSNAAAFQDCLNQRHSVLSWLTLRFANTAFSISMKENSEATNRHALPSSHLSRLRLCFIPSGRSGKEVCRRLETGFGRGESARSPWRL